MFLELETHLGDGVQGHPARMARCAVLEKDGVTGGEGLLQTNKLEDRSNMGIHRD